MIAFVNCGFIKIFLPNSYFIFQIYHAKGLKWGMLHLDTLIFSRIFIKCFKASILLSGPNRFSVGPSYLYSLWKYGENRTTYLNPATFLTEFLSIFLKNLAFFLLLNFLSSLFRILQMRAKIHDKFFKNCDLNCQKKQYLTISIWNKTWFGCIDMSR